MEALALLDAAPSAVDGVEQMSGVGDALTLMVIGMCTVFIVLLLVIGIGKCLIWIVNNFCPEEVAAPVAKSSSSSVVDPATAEAIAKAVAQLTGGKGKVESISKL